MGKKLLFVIVVLAISILQLKSKSLGNYKNHHQISNKQVLIETTKDFQLLITAYSNLSLGFEILDKYAVANLIKPEDVGCHPELEGAIYVDDIEYMMEIYTPERQGVKISIEKNPLSFKFIDEASGKTMASSKKGFKIKRNKYKLNFLQHDNETLSWLNKSSLAYHMLDVGNTPMQDGENDKEAFLLFSSKGYGLMFPESRGNGSIQLTYKNSYKIELEKEQRLAFIFLLGSNNESLVNRFHKLTDKGSLEQLTLSHRNN